MLLFAAAPIQRQGDWWDRTDPGPRQSVPRSRFYTIRSDLPYDETKSYADLLDTMYLEYTRLMKGLRRRGSEHLDVYIFASPQDYRDTLRTRFGANATGSGGMFFVGPRGAGLAFFTGGQPRSRVEHVIRHEGFHQIAYVYFEGDLPPWANEGLAEYFGEAVIIEGTIIEGQVTPRSLAKAKELIERNRVIPFAEVLSRDLRTWNGAVANGSAESQYLQSASMIQFLLWGEGGRLSSNFSAYLRALNEGRDSLSAFRSAFGGSDDRALADFERRWRAFVQAQTPGSVRSAAERLQFMAEGVLFLRERGIHPRTIDELREALVKEKFEQSVGSHGPMITLRADDEALFSIPADLLQDRKKAPSFSLVARGPKPAAKKSGEKKRGGAEGGDGTDDESSETVARPSKPPPLPELGTKNLRPRDLKISWSQAADGRWRAELRLK